MAPPSKSLSTLFARAKLPLICNAPMAGVAGPSLAAEVTGAGGFGRETCTYRVGKGCLLTLRAGFLGCTINISPGSGDLEGLREKLDEVRRLLGHNATDNGVLPIGFGFLTWHPSITHFSETVLPIVKEYRPAAVWLFAPGEELKPHKDIITSLKTLNPSPAVFVQVGNVSAARDAAQDGADVIVCQGIDAGGHQFRKGSGVVTLVPEVRGMLDREFTDRSISVFAAGGIADGRGVAAMLALGA